ncbi:MAG TPA: PTS sugar transporter subunit IIC [Pseudonocardiaceae bacterium]|jgi:mannose/fructose/N-acetylgalactosamine-specific phosphotransferase system component IIC|nr:PTS sugar transporter subunit IIC [Pseudonocardiaceae bacterium]
MLIALLLTVWAIFCIFDNLGPYLIYASRPLIAGTVAGLLVGNVTLGMAIGATLEFAALGSYTYGGASTPDWPTGAIIAVALANVSGAPTAQAISLGVTFGLAAALVLTPLDPIGRSLTTLFIHRADKALVEGRTRELTVLHWTAFIPWAAVRAIPTFVLTYFLKASLVQSVESSIPKWLVDGLQLSGGLLPAVGFAMLLGFLPVRKYWYMLMIGFVLFGYAKIPVLGVAMFGLAIAIIFILLKPSASTPAAAAAAPPPPSTPATTSATSPAESSTEEEASNV